MRDHIQPELRTIFADLLGSAAAEIDPQRPFVDMGLDSLAFLQASQAIQQRLGVKVAFRQLVEELTTLERLEQYVDEAWKDAAPTVPATSVSPPAPAPPTPAASREALAATMLDVRSAATAGSAIDRIIAQQLNILSQQLQLLRAGDGRKAVALPDRGHASAVPVTADVPERRFVAHEPIQPHRGEALSPS